MKTLLKIVLFLFTISIYSQEMPSIKVGNDKLGITSLDINVEVVGNIATTTYDMLFYNPTNSILEGELAFPLGEGQQVSRLALEVNGKLREAVVVEKEQGRIAFEAVVRRGVDPVLLEKGTGNNYKARIYPIPARGYKRVVLAHEQELILSEGAHYFHLPLGFKKHLDHFAFEMNIFNQKLKPELAKGTIDNFSFKELNNNYYGKIEKKNFTPAESLVIKIPQNYINNKVIVSEDYFYLYKTLHTDKKQRQKAKKIILYWDTSLSMKSRDLDKEITFLKKYIEHLNSVEIQLVKFSNEITITKNFKIKNGNFADLKNELINTIYDGGTSYTSLFTNSKTDEILLFSDGMKNLSDISVSSNKPIFIVNSIVKANHSELNNISETTNGKYINLKNLSVDEALDKITHQAFKFLGFEVSNTNIEIYPNMPMTVSADFSVSGKNFNLNDSIVLNFGYGNEVSQKQTLIIDSEINNQLVKRIWAQKKLKELENESDLNKDEIVKHSKLYNLVSNHTSLIVLETVWDYVRYKITPPEELLEEYNRILDRNNGKKVVSVQNKQNEETRDEQEIALANNASGNISGKITDSSGIPLVGVNVLLKGTSTGTLTDFDGNYSINAIPSAELTFSYIGYQTLETTVGSANSINISMSEDTAALDEVIVVGYGTRTRNSVTGSVTQVKTKEIGSFYNGNNIANVLQGRAAGLQVVQNNQGIGASPNIRIRGLASLTNDGQPLFVLDGVPVSGNIDDLINTSNIESITVLKGVSAAAIYGSRASNGVIVITSKFNNNNRFRNHNYSRTNRNKHKYKGRLKVKTETINEPYIVDLLKSKSIDEAYKTYLNQREEFGHLPAYYIDVYDYFKKWNNDQYALKILTNVAELDLDNYELLRVLAYKLEESDNYGLASYIYAQVLKLRPEDSQSYRDLALAYQEIGLVQESFNLLNSIVTGKIYANSDRRKFDGMQRIAKNEINKLIQNNTKIDKENFQSINEINTFFDVRVVIDWNHNDTDIDLHVIDPMLEECYYGHSKTTIGGEISRDMTQGFGPEEFTLKYAKPGTYFIKINYYGDRYQKIENPTFMKVTMFKNFGKPTETKEIKIIRLTKPRDKQMVAKLEI